ncbi:MAG TPA: hypothetical protein VLW55_26755 [Burkholderiaceae bacterium]|nr:hypothetical protein [Burkholderiaceae bacterium]
MKRRAVLLSAAALGAGKVVAAATEPTKAEDRPTPWVVRPQLTARKPAVVWDLSASLPPGVKRGGRFYVDPSGASLPPGVRLSPQGILSVTDEARAGSTEGVVFGYTEPS